MYVVALASIRLRHYESLARILVRTVVRKVSEAVSAISVHTKIRASD